jgi:hypothetical protein
MAPLGISSLGLPIEPISGVGGLGFSYFTNITVDLQGLTQFPLYASFADALNHWGVGLLGQRGFFDKFVVHFDLPNNVFHLEI